MSAIHQRAYVEANPEREKARKARDRAKKKGLQPPDMPPVETATVEDIASRLYHIWGPADVERWFRQASERGARVCVNQGTLGRLSTMDLVPNEPFRLAYQKAPGEHKEGLRKSICKELAVLEKLDKQPPNAYGSRSFGDKRLISQHLGIELRNGDGYTMQIFIDYRFAEAICKAMGLCAPEVGI